MSFGGPPQGPFDGGRQGQGQGPYGGQQHPPTAPDWQGLAAQADAQRARRRRRLFVGGAALAAVAVAGIVAAVLVSSGGGDPDADASNLPKPQKLGPKPSATPSPSFSDVSPPPPPDPLDYISTAKKDKAPLSAKTLFPGGKMTTDGRTYTKGATAGTRSCSAPTKNGLGPVLARNGCKQLFRATYTRGGVAVTVGIAVFDRSSQASKAKSQSRGFVLPLAGGGVKPFCHATSCRLTANALGRYAYFTIAGYTSGRPVQASDTKARAAGRDAGAYAFNRILARGKEQAEAAGS